MRKAKTFYVNIILLNSCVRVHYSSSYDTAETQSIEERGWAERSEDKCPKGSGDIDDELQTNVKWTRPCVSRDCPSAGRAWRPWRDENKKIATRGHTYYTNKILPTFDALDSIILVSGSSTWYRSRRVSICYTLYTNTPRRRSTRIPFVRCLP